MFCEDKNMELVYDKKCPICGCEKMIRRETPAVLVNTNCESDAIKLSAFKSAVTTRYICYDCGYLLRFYEGKELKKLKDFIDKK